MRTPRHADQGCEPPGMRTRDANPLECGPGMRTPRHADQGCKSPRMRTRDANPLKCGPGMGTPRHADQGYKTPSMRTRYRMQTRKHANQGCELVTFSIKFEFSRIRFRLSSKLNELFQNRIERFCSTSPSSSPQPSCGRSRKKCEQLSKAITL